MSLVHIPTKLKSSFSFLMNNHTFSPKTGYLLPPPSISVFHKSSAPSDYSCDSQLKVTLTMEFPSAFASAIPQYPQKTMADSKNSLCHLAPLEAVLFDIDGTLCDSDPLHFQVFHDMLLKINYNGGVPITRQFYSEKFSGKHEEDLAKVLFPDDVEKGRKIVREKEVLFHSAAKEKLKPVNGVEKLKKWIQDRGLKRVAVTNSPRENAQLMLSTLGLTDFFQDLIVGDECEHFKPHPAPYLKALEVLKVSKEHTMVFEDSPAGMRAAVAAGLPVVGLLTGNSEQLLLAEKPAFLIQDYNDPKLWAALDELDKQGKAGTAAA